MSGLKIFSWGRRSARDPMVDIERLLLEYAWTEIADATCFDKAFRNKKYKLDVNWGYIDISHHLTSFTLRSRDERSHKNRTMDNLKAKVAQRDLCLFRTEFSNSSPTAQTFTFKTERRTTSRCEVSLQRGFTVGSKVDVQLSIPSPGQAELASLVQDKKVDLCQITGGLSGELHMTKTSGQTFEEELTWGVDSQVTVAGGTRVEASLLIREEELTADFTMNSVIRAMHPVIPVYVRDKKTHRVLELLEIPSENLCEILNDAAGFIKVDDNKVICETKGSLRAVYGAEQIIRIEPMPLKPVHRGDRYNEISALEVN